VGATTDHTFFFNSESYHYLKPLRESFESLWILDKSTIAGFETTKQQIHVREELVEHESIASKISQTYIWLIYYITLFPASFWTDKYESVSQMVKQENENNENKVVDQFGQRSIYLLLNCIFTGVIIRVIMHSTYDKFMAPELGYIFYYGTLAIFFFNELLVYDLLNQFNMLDEVYNLIYWFYGLNAKSMEASKLPATVIAATQMFVTVTAWADIFSDDTSIQAFGSAIAWLLAMHYFSKWIMSSFVARYKTILDRVLPMKPLEYHSTKNMTGRILVHNAPQLNHDLQGTAYSEYYQKVNYTDEEVKSLLPRKDRKSRAKLIKLRRQHKTWKIQSCSREVEDLRKQIKEKNYNQQRTFREPSPNEDKTMIMLNDQILQNFDDNNIPEDYLERNISDDRTDVSCGGIGDDDDDGSKDSHLTVNAGVMRPVRSDAVLEADVSILTGTKNYDTPDTQFTGNAEDTTQAIVPQQSKSSYELDKLEFHVSWDDNTDLMEAKRTISNQDNTNDISQLELAKRKPDSSNIKERSQSPDKSITISDPHTPIDK